MRTSDRKRVLRGFKQRGISVHVGALECLYEGYEKTINHTDEPFEKFLDKAFELLSRPDGATDGILTKQLAKNIADRLTRDTSRSDGNFDEQGSGGGDIRSHLEVIDTFKIPQWKPNTSGSMLSSSNNISVRPIIDAPAIKKSEMFRLRYELHLSKALRNKNFKSSLYSGLKSTSGSSSSRKSVTYHLTGIEILQHENENDEEKLVLGMLTQLEEGIWYLEDLHGCIKLDLSDVQTTAGLHTDGGFIIAQGKLVEEFSKVDKKMSSKFKVSALGTPIHEPRERTIDYLGKDANLFGGASYDALQMEALMEKEHQLADDFFLILSDVAVDNPRILAGIRHLFKGYLEDEVIPSVIVLMGKFLSHSFGQQPNDMQLLRDGFKRLGEMIKTEFELIAKSSIFLIVPSTIDPGPGNILPRPPLPNTLLRPFIDILGTDRVYSCTNPCRMRYLSQEIVIMRDNILQKMVRHCCIKPDFTQSKLLAEHMLKSMIDQAYMSPLPLSARPVLWAHHHALWLFPTPHVLITADKVDGFVCKYEGCLGMNPGSFSTDFSFQIYLPSERRAQQCSLNSEEVETPVAKDSEKNAGDPVAKDDDNDEESNSPKNDDIIDGLEQNPDVGDLKDPEDPMEDDEMEEAEDWEEEEVGEVEDSEDDEDNAEISDGNLDEDDQHSEQSVEDSDDDSLLVPAKGLKKIDIKSLVRNALAGDTSTIGQGGNNDSEDEKFERATDSESEEQNQAD